MKTLRRLRATMSFLIAIHGCSAAAIAHEHGPSFAPICAEREVQVITLLEDHARAKDASANALGEAGLTRMEAQTTCYQGRVVEAVAIYDGIIARLGPVLARATR